MLTSEKPDEFCSYNPMDFEVADGGKTMAEFTMQLNSPITEEQWNAITDAELEHSKEIEFTTPSGKKVLFQKVKRGKWVEKHHAYSDEENPIEEWQSCKCSECGRYDTRPYLYYFSEPRFCSWCGADMGGEDDA